MNLTRLWQILTICAVSALVAVVAVWLSEDGEPRTYEYLPPWIMGTKTQLKVVAPPARRKDVTTAMRDAEQALRDVEFKMSTYIEASELSQFNAAPAGETVKLSAETLGLLRVSRRIAEQTDGAFDVTCGPIIDLWRKAAEDGRLPGDKDIARALAVCGWDKVRLLDGGAQKTVDGVRIGLGGIAKGFGIDRAAEVLEAAGLQGGLVNVGGDVRCFGGRAGGGKWRFGIQSPFSNDEEFAKVEISRGAVCTSGNYKRFFKVGKERFSHIVDPRTGRPVDIAPSVTVVAETATAADAWATALSVLGPDGLELIPPDSGIRAMLIIGGPEDFRLVMSPGFEELLTKRPFSHR